MPDIPDMSQYIYRHETYNQFIALTAFLGFLFVPALLRFKAGKAGFTPTIKLWHILLIGAALRLPALMTQEYWYDEAFTSSLVQASWADMFTAVTGDVHPPLYYAIVKATTLLIGHHDITMRLPAFISSLGLIVVASQIGKLHGSERIGQYAAILTAIMPGFIYYGAEARYPSFLALMLGIAYIQMKQQGCGSGLALSLASLSHVNAWFPVGIMILSLLYKRQWRKAILPVMAMGAWLPVAASQAADVVDGFWLRQSLPIRHIADITMTTRFENGFPVGLVAVGLVIVFSIMGVSIWSWREQVDALWLGLALGVPAIQWLIGFVWHPVYLERSMLFSVLLLFVPIATWLEQHKQRLVMLAGVLVVILGNYGIYTTPRYDEEAVAAITACDNEPIYAINTKTAIYARHFSDSHVAVFEHGNGTAQYLSDEARRALFDEVTTLSTLADNCLVAQIDNFTSVEELEHIEAITEDYTVVQGNNYLFFVVAHGAGG